MAYTNGTYLAKLGLGQHQMIEMIIFPLSLL